MKQYCFYQNYREIKLLVIHCSATRYDRDFPVEALRGAHKDRGFADIGYHYYITRDGELHRCRPENQIGAFATRVDWMSEDFPRIPGRMPSGVP